VRHCAKCGVPNRPEGHWCRGCGAELGPEEFREWADCGSPQIARLQYSTWVRPRFCQGYLWFLTTEGEIHRVSPNGHGQCWNHLPEASFARAPFAIYPDEASSTEEPYLIVLKSHEVLAISLINPRRTKSLYRPAGNDFLVCSRQEDRYVAVAAWSRGVAFLESSEGKQKLVVVPFDGQPRKQDIDDSTVVVGPAARGDSICFCTSRRLYWYQVARGELQSADFPLEFHAFDFRPRLEVVNLAPGVVPLTVETSAHSSYAYVFGAIGDRGHYLGARLSQSIDFESRMFSPGSFVDLGVRNELCVNASKEVWVLTAEGTRKISCGLELRNSMPAVPRNGVVFGFQDAPGAPVVCGAGKSEALQSNLDDCNEHTLMGWIPHVRGVCLVARKSEELQVAWWEIPANSGKARTAYGS